MTATFTANLARQMSIPHFTSGYVALPPSEDSELTVHVILSPDDFIHNTDGDLIFLQASQTVAGEQNYPDAFALQIVEVQPQLIIMRVRRVDSDNGWGQGLKIGLLIVRGFAPPGP